MAKKPTPSRKDSKKRRSSDSSEPLIEAQPPLESTEPDEPWEPEEPQESDESEPPPELLPVQLGQELSPNWSSSLESTSLNDPLRRYLEEVRRYPMLDPETEMSLAERMIKLNDIEAAKALVQANLRLVVKIAFEYHSITANLLDMIQEGNIGLMKAVSKFDPTKGVRLGYYATWWIRSHILKYLLDNFRLVKIGTTQAQKKLFYHLMREKQRLEAQGLFAGPRLLAEKLEVREKDVIEMEQRLSGRGTELSIDTPLDSHSESQSTSTFRDSLVDPSENPEARLAREQLIKTINNKLPDLRQELNEKELRILEERILAEEPKTLQEIADHYGLTRERARQIEAKLLEKLRSQLRDLLKD